MNITPLAINHKKLREHLICNKMHNADEFCWKPAEPPFNGKVCIILSAAHVMAWASAMTAGTTTIFAPPNEPMFWNLKEAHLKGRNKQRRKSDPFESSTREPVVIQLQDHTGRRYPETPMRPRAKSFDISPVRGFNPRQYNSDGLLAYLQWLDNTYPDDGYLEIFPILSHEMLGIDIFKTATARDGSAKELVTELKKDLGIKVGMARRLVEKFREWQRSLAPAMP